MTPATLSLIKKVINWRKDGLAVYFTLNTGQDLHLITEEKDSDHLRRKLQQVREVKKIIVNRPSVGTRINNDHLF